MAEVALQRAEQPFEVAKQRRAIEAEFEAQLGEVFRSRLILQDGGGEVARQDFGSDEDERRRGQKRQDAEHRPLDDQLSHAWPAFVARRMTKRAGSLGAPGLVGG